MSPPSSRQRNRGRRFSPIELAIGFSLGGTLLAIVVPTFAHELHASRLVEPVDGLHRIGAAAVAYAQDHTTAEAFPPPVGATPPVPPRGRCVADPDVLWEQPTWQALTFRPAEPGAPHCFTFEFSSNDASARSGFRATAHGDLDGDGAFSTFEITGHAVDQDPAGPAVDPGMYVDEEVE